MLRGNDVPLMQKNEVCSFREDRYASRVSQSRMTCHKFRTKTEIIEISATINTFLGYFILQLVLFKYCTEP